MLAWDPGVTTGWALYDVHRETLVEAGAKEAIRAGQGCAWTTGNISSVVPGAPYGVGEVGAVRSMLRRAVWALEWCEFDVDRGDVFVCVMESFVLRRSEMDASLLAPVRIRAAWEFAVAGSGMLGWVQSPADAKAVITDGRLRDWGHWFPPEDSGRKTALSPHEHDAQRHAILALRKMASRRGVAGACLSLGGRGFDVGRISSWSQPPAPASSLAVV